MMSIGYPVPNSDSVRIADSHGIERIQKMTGRKTGRPFYSFIILGYSFNKLILFF